MATNYPPKKNVAFTMGFFISKSDGTIIANPTLTGSNVHTDLGTTEVTNSTLAVVDATSGLCSIALAQGTMNGDQIDGTITSSSTGAVVEKFKLMTSSYTNDEIGAALAAIHTAVDDADSGLPALHTHIAAIPTTAMLTPADILDHAIAGHNTAGTVGAQVTLLTDIDSEVDLLKAGGALHVAIDHIDSHVDAILAFGAPPAVATIAAGVWDYATSALTTAGSVGKRFIEFVTTLVYAAPDNTGIGAIHTAVDDGTAGLEALYTILGAHTDRFTSVDNQLDHIHSGLDVVDGMNDTITGLVENVGGHNRFTAVALEAGPVDGAAPTVGHIRTELATELAAVLDTHTDVGTALTNIAAIKTVADTAAADALAVHTAADTLFDGTGAISVKSISVVNDNGPALLLDATDGLNPDGGQASGLFSRGHGYGAWFQGVQGAGLVTEGGTSGPGIFAFGTGGNAGIEAKGEAGAGIQAEGLGTGYPAIWLKSSTGDGIYGTIGTGKEIIAGLVDSFWDEIISTGHTGAGKAATVLNAAAADALAAHTKVDALHDFDPAADTVAHVTLVDTTTTNTDALQWLYVPPTP
jgi:hypothetical protein